LVAGVVGEGDLLHSSFAFFCRWLYVNLGSEFEKPLFEAENQSELEKNPFKILFLDYWASIFPHFLHWTASGK